MQHDEYDETPSKFVDKPALRDMPNWSNPLLMAAVSQLASNALKTCFQMMYGPDWQDAADRYVRLHVQRMRAAIDQQMAKHRDEVIAHPLDVFITPNGIAPNRLAQIVEGQINEVDDFLRWSLDCMPRQKPNDEDEAKQE